jgi:hypothetical protein
MRGRAHGDGRTAVSRQRRTKDEGLALAADWLASGLSAAEYSRTHQVPAHRLAYWSRRAAAMRSCAAESAPTFVAMTVGAGGHPQRAELGERGYDTVTVFVGSQVSVRLSMHGGREPFVQALRWIMEAAGA